MADDDIWWSIIEFLLRQPIPDRDLHLIIAALPLSSSCLPPRVFKTLLLRRLAACLTATTTPKTLDTIERIELLDRKHRLTAGPSPALQLAYSAAAVDLTVKEGSGGLGDFLNAVSWIWNSRVGDLERSEGRGLVSGRLREERRLVEAAVVSLASRDELMARQTSKEAAEAITAYLREAAEEMGLTHVEKAAAAVLKGHEEARGGRFGGSVPAGGNVASVNGESSKCSFKPSTSKEDGYRRTGGERDQNMTKGLISDVVPEYQGPPTVGTGNDLNLEKSGEHQSLNKAAIDNGEKVCPAENSFDTGQKAEDGIAPHPSIIVQDTTEIEREEEDFHSALDQSRAEAKHAGEDQDILGGNATTVSEGTAPVNTEGRSTLVGKKRDAHAVKSPSIMERNSTAKTTEWHDSIDSSPDRPPDTSARSRNVLPKKRENSGTNVPWDKELMGRRRKKWWSADEEDTLREAVDKYGVGNWAMIKSSYPEIFLLRTSGDLKDKWRNMTK